MQNSSKVTTSPLLVTGSHRSGSTWVGRVIATAPEVFYVHEPTNPRMAPHYLELDSLPYYWKVTEAEEAHLQQGFSRILSGQFPKINARFFRPRRRFISKYPQAFLFRWAALRHRRFLIKDPLMIFNTAWFERHFAARTVLVSRSAYGFVASIKVKNWTFDFTNWTSQPELMASLLPEESEAVARAVVTPLDLIDQACLIWLVLTRYLSRLADENPRRVICNHEELCQNPYTAFQKLFAELNLTWTSQTEKFLRAGKRAALDTPSASDQIIGSEFHNLWRTRLTEKEIQRIHEKTGMFDTPKSRG